MLQQELNSYLIKLKYDQNGEKESLKNPGAVDYLDNLLMQY